MSGARRDLVALRMEKFDDYRWLDEVQRLPQHQAAEYVRRRPVTTKAVVAHLLDGSLHPGTMLVNAFYWHVDLYAVAFGVRNGMSSAA